jgi:hypothetical protein
MSLRIHCVHMSSSESLGIILLIVVFLCRLNAEPGVSDL